MKLFRRKKRNNKIEEPIKKVTETYEQLTDGYNKLKENIDKNIQKYAREGVPYEKMIELLSEKMNNLFEIDRKRRYVQEPEITYGKQYKGVFFTIEEFKEKSISGELNDSDGHGYYATETAMSNIMAYPSDFILELNREDFTHVNWLEKQKD